VSARVTRNFLQNIFCGRQERWERVGMEGGERKEKRKMVRRECNSGWAPREHELSGEELDSFPPFSLSRACRHPSLPSKHTPERQAAFSKRYNHVINERY
jgi:hypothetical protein